MKLIIDIPKYVYDLASKEDIIVDADIDKVTAAIKAGVLYKERPAEHRIMNERGNYVCPACGIEHNWKNHEHIICVKCGTYMRGIAE